LAFKRATLPAVATKVKGRCDNLVAGVDAQRHQRQQKRIRSGSASDRERGANEGRYGGLQLLYLRPHDELLALEDFVDGSPDFVFHRAVFGLQVEKGKEHLGSAVTN
jgi:hypothetical protein